MSEICQRCRSVGEDRRTIRVACFYALEETGLPFEKPSEGGGLYTLRVCKRCRAELMEYLKRWFSAIPGGMDNDADSPEPDPTSPNSGIYVRELGAVREISRQEWETKYGGSRLRQSPSRLRQSPPRGDQGDYTDQN